MEKSKKNGKQRSKEEKKDRSETAFLEKRIE